MTWASPEDEWRKNSRTAKHQKGQQVKFYIHGPTSDDGAYVDDTVRRNVGIQKFQNPRTV